ncbi:unnamed protein product [Rotaria sp. Silwood2]|nr:unnamed protein product [Rotaria sp. Silwood2]
MDDYSIESMRDTNADAQETSDYNLQKPNIYNKYLPFYKSIKRHASDLFEEIRENLSRTIQLGELRPGFAVWSNELKRFISLYGFYFTKDDHLKLINFYLSILSITDLSYPDVEICFDTLFDLMRKTSMITRDDLIIDWRLLYRWAQLIHDLHNKTSALVALPNCRMDAIGIIYREFRSERKVRPFWFFIPHETYRLTEQDTIDFVNCIKEYAFISIFNKDHNKEAAEACQYLSMLLPELIVPSLVEQLFSSLDNMTEPHRFTSIIICLTRVARQIVRQTPSYSEGQIYVLPLLMSVLPGIDLNDFQKITVTLEFLDTILKLITCVDCSSAVHIRTDLTDIEKEVCLSTVQFEDFITELLHRIFQMIEILSTELSDVRKLVAGLIRALVKGNPIETLKYFLPKTCESIENIMDHADSSGLLIDHKGDIELNWYLILFAEFLRARGDTLLIYKQMIMSIFHRCIYLIHKDSYEAVASAAKHLLKSLSHVYPMEYQLTVENFDEPFVNFLPIRAWGQAADFDNLQIQFHIPNENEIDFACEFVETFLYLELRLLNEKCLKMSNNERLRSLTFIHHITIGCFRMVPHVDSEKLPNL